MERQTVDGRPADQLPTEAKQSVATKWPQFGLGTLMLIMLVSAVTSGIGSYVVRAMAQGTSGKAFFVIFTLIMPILLVVFLNFARLFVALLDKMNRQR